MSEIIIKGMKMLPEGYAYEVIIRGNGDVLDAETGMKMGTAVGLPSHGDLISKQETVKKLMNAMCKGCKHTDDCSWCAMAEYRRIVEDAPTVLEASEEQGEKK